jgi:hypothetical protein
MTMIQSCADSPQHLTNGFRDGFTFLEICAFVCDGRGGFVG